MILELHKWNINCLRVELTLFGVPSLLCFLNKVDAVDDPELLEVVDEYISDPVWHLDRPFLIPIEDVFSIQTTVTGVEMFKNFFDHRQEGDNVGLLLRGLKRDDVQRGMVVTKPGALKTYKKLEVEIYVLSKDDGALHTAFFSNYKPQFYLRTADVSGKVQLPENAKMVTATFELTSYVPLAR